MSAGTQERKSAGAGQHRGQLRAPGRSGAFVDRVSDLRVYQSARSSAMRLFALSRSWPKAERYALTDQARRSSRSVCANIAEAWAKRPYPKHFVSKLSDAHAEAEETRVWIGFAHDCGYIDHETAVALESSYRLVVGGLVKMMRDPASWCRAITN